LHREAAFGSDGQEREVHSPTEGTGIEGGGVARDPQDILVGLAIATRAASTLDAVQGLETLGVESEERQAQEVGLGLDELGDCVSVRGRRGLFNARLAS